MKASMFAFVSLLLLDGLIVFLPSSSLMCYREKNNVVQLNGLRVFNRNTGKSYATIQEAINTPETLDGHEIFVASGTYNEHITVNKSLSLRGEDRGTTIIDGSGTGTVVYVTADNVRISNFTIQNGTFGLWLNSSGNSRIIGNTLQKGAYGIRLYHSKSSEVRGNEIRSYTYFGIELDSSGNSTLRNNKLAENKYNFGVDGTSLSDFINDIDASNTVNGEPVRYLINRHNITVDSSSFQGLGYLAIVNSTDIKVKNLKVQGNIQGILLAFTANSAINNVNAKSNWNGIYMTHSWNISVSGNNANSNFDYGIKFFNSSRSLARRNNVDNNGWAGIGLFGSPNSTIDGNEANFNTYNLHIVFTNNSVITRNHALNRPGGNSIAVYYSHNNLVYHNTFANSLLYVETRNGASFTPGNSWDNGLEGNFWNSFVGVDADEDGIKDAPYIIGENNVDNYPLSGRFSDYTVTVGERTYTIAIISNSTISQFRFSPEDGEVSFVATGIRETMGFSRITVPNTLLQHIEVSNLTFFINSERPSIKRHWTDGLHMYWYFSYVNSVSEPTISSWLLVALASVSLIVVVLVVAINKKKRMIGSRTFRNKVTTYG